MITRSILSCLFLLLYQFSIAQSQVAVATLCRGDAPDIGSIQLDDESYITNGEILPNNLTLEKLPAQQDGFLEMTLDNLENSGGYNFSIALQEVGHTTSTECYKLQVTQSSATNALIIATGATNSFHSFGNTFQNGTVLQIERCANTIVFRVDDNEHIITPTENIQDMELEAFLEVTEGKPNNNGDCPAVELTFPKLSNGKVYVALNTKIDGSYIELVNQQLRFWYEEKYAIVPDDGNDPPENEMITCNIYDWERTLKETIDLNNEYGVNWKVIDLSDPNNLTSGEYYVMEVHNANKGSTYYLRFKY